MALIYLVSEGPDVRDENFWFTDRKWAYQMKDLYLYDEGAIYMVKECFVDVWSWNFCKYLYNIYKNLYWISKLLLLLDITVITQAVFVVAWRIGMRRRKDGTATL